MFFFRCVSISLPLPLLIPLFIGLSFLCSLLRSMFFLPYVRVLCGWLLFGSIVFAFVCVFVSCCLFVFISSASLPGDDIFCWLLSSPFPSVCFPCFFFSECVPVLIWFGSVYLGTTARFIMDQSM